MTLTLDCEGFKIANLAGPATAKDASNFYRILPHAALNQKPYFDLAFTVDRVHMALKLELRALGR